MTASAKSGQKTAADGENEATPSWKLDILMEKIKRQQKPWNEIIKQVKLIKLVGQFLFHK